MGIKELKEMKSKLALQLTELLQTLISGATIETVVSDDLETLQAVITSQIEKDTGTTVHITNLLTFNVNNPKNIMFSGSNRTVLKTEAKDVAGIVANNTQIDLLTLESLKNTMYQFCIDHDLVDVEIENNKDAGVGENEQN
jgi:hypothetical protein